MKRLAILGGTFNPVHLGHLILADTALTQYNLDQVLWVPSRYAHYKPSHEVLAFSHRTEMLRRAIAPHPQFVMPEVRQSPSNPSYALELFQQLQPTYPDAAWFWIIGLDAFQSLPHWYGRQTLMQHCTWLVAPRFDLDTLRVADFVQDSGSLDPTPLTTWVISQTERTIQDVAHRLEQQKLTLQWRSLQMPLLPISSRMIRTYCRTRRSLRYWVPDSVSDYIAAHDLYASP